MSQHSCFVKYRGAQGQTESIHDYTTDTKKHGYE